MQHVELPVAQAGQEGGQFVLFPLALRVPGTLDFRFPGTKPTLSVPGNLFPEEGEKDAAVQSQHPLYLPGGRFVVEMELACQFHLLV